MMVGSIPSHQLQCKYFWCILIGVMYDDSKWIIHLLLWFKNSLLDVYEMAITHSLLNMACLAQTRKSGFQANQCIGGRDQMRLHSINRLGLDESAFEKVKGTQSNCTPRIETDYMGEHSKKCPGLYESAFVSDLDYIKLKVTFNFFDPDHIRVHSWKNFFRRYPSESSFGQLNRIWNFPWILISISKP